MIQIRVRPREKPKDVTLQYEPNGLLILEFGYFGKGWCSDIEAIYDAVIELKLRDKKGDITQSNPLDVRDRFFNHPYWMLKFNEKGEKTVPEVVTRVLAGNYRFTKNLPEKKYELD